jgi:hypothetical protein
MLLSIGVSTLPSCYGKFMLTRKLYTWNGTVGSKFVNSLVMWGLIIIPVYEVCGVVDFLVVNTIEFWQGKNPMSMKEGELETQITEVNGVRVEVTASRNRLDIAVLDGKDAGKSLTMVYDQSTKTWNAVTESGSTPVARLMPEEERLVEFIKPSVDVIRWAE